MRDVKYLVWALGFDKDNFCTDLEIFLGAFGTAEEAIHHAEQFTTVKAIIEFSEYNPEILETGDYFEVRVETTKISDSSSCNVDTKFSKFVY